MAWQAIVTKFLSPTNTRGARIKATAQAGSVTVGYDYGLNSDDNHKRAAEALAAKFEWRGRWFDGGAPDGCGNVYVWAPFGSNPAFHLKGKPDA